MKPLLLKIDGKYVVSLLLLFVGYCAKTIPVEELSRAKYDINRAEAVRSEQYAKEPYTQARQALLEAHDAVEKEDMDLAKKKAEEASAKAKEAYSIAAPQLAQETRSGADASLRQAEEANAEVFAPVEFRNAKAAFSAGDGHLAKQEYMEAIRKFEESREEANKALSISEGQIDGMRRQLTEIEEKIKEAEKLGAAEYAPDSLSSAKESAQLAKQHLAEKKLKLASEDLKKGSEQANLALKISQKEWARRKYVEAEAAVQNAESNVIKLRSLAEREENKKVLQESQDAQDSLTAAEDTLEAAKESLRRAESEYKAENYVASYNHSEEAIRLAKIVNEQIPNVELIFVQARSASTKEAEASETEKTEAKEDVAKETREGWKTYKVRLIPHRRDCLWRIAEYKFIYGNPYLWPKIYRANKSQIKNPDLIYPGQVFDIPPKDWKGGEPPKKEVQPKASQKEKGKKPKKEPTQDKEDKSEAVETMDEYQKPVIPEEEYEED